MCFVYVIRSTVRKYIYVGLTMDLSERLGQHNSGKNSTTKPYRPFDLILSEKFETRTEARAREKFLKSGIGKEFLKSIE
jgi:putative endonuclease